MQLTEHTYFGEGNRYYLEKLLGRGGFSEVWLVKDTLTETEEALKVYAPGIGMDDDGLHIFTKELNVVHNIHHPNLLTSSYVGVWQNMPYLIMPYCPQGSLVKKIGQITEDEAWAILKDVATGLEYLHSQPSPIIHQDIKPDNILVDALGHYVITDFGISARAQSTLRKSIRNAANGTSAYMSPERFGTDPLPVKASDVWALGATLFELIEGYAPFGDLGGLSQKSGADIPHMKADVSDKLKQSIYSMLIKEPWDRPTAVRLSKGGSITPTPDRKRPIVVGKKQSKGTTKWIWVALLLASLAIIGMSVYNIIDHQRQELIARDSEAEAKRLREENKRLVEAEETRLAKEQEEQAKRDAETIRLQEENKRLTAELEANKIEEKEHIQQQSKSSSAAVNNSSNRLSFAVKGVPFTMIEIEGGTFTMGATSEQGSDADSEPTHSVTLSTYYMGETEVTQALWQAVIGNNPSFNADNRPAGPVSYDDCKTFVSKLNGLLSSQLGGKRFALPTEAQWEYAARGGKKSKGYKYSGSNSLSAVAWYTDNSDGAIHPVKMKQANELGLYDMSGNAWEWCLDWYDDYSSSSQVNPQGPYRGSFRVCRGGGWGSGARRCSVSSRSGDSPSLRISNHGLRLCLLP